MFHINILSLINPGHFCKKSVCFMFWDICEEKYGKMKCFSLQLPSFSRPLSPLFSRWILIVCAHQSRLQLRSGVGTESVRPSLSKISNHQHFKAYRRKKRWLLELEPSAFRILNYLYIKHCPMLKRFQPKCSHDAKTSGLTERNWTGPSPFSLDPAALCPYPPWAGCPSSAGTCGGRDSRKHSHKRQRLSAFNNCYDGNQRAVSENRQRQIPLEERKSRTQTE